MKRAEILGLPVDVLSFPATLRFIEKAVKNSRRCFIVTLNAETVWQAQNDPELAEIIRRASLIVPDGTGIRWALRKKFGIVVQRIPGIDLLVELVKLHGHEWRFYFVGAEAGVASRAAYNLRLFGHSCNFRTHHGYFTRTEEAALLEDIRSYRPHILAVGMGTPRQEKWLHKYKLYLDVPVLMGVGGAFDCLSKKLRRCPAWMQKAGLEWLYRVIQEPRRWPRILRLVRFYFLVKQAEGKNGP